MRIAVFVSGRGSNLKALLDENKHSEIFVFSNKKREPQAFAWARRRGVSTELVSLQDESDWEALAEKLNFLKIKKVLLLGFMKIAPEVFLSRLQADCINLHPSLLPAFPGLKSIEKTFESKKSMGCTVHQVSALVDSGKIYLQKEIRPPFLKFSKFVEQVHFAEQESVAKHCDRSLINMGTGSL